MTFLDRNQDQPPPGTIDPGPPGTPNPPARPAYSPRQPGALFIKNSPNRDPQDWGGDWWPNTSATSFPGRDEGPYMPSPPEAYPTLASSAGQAARWAAPGVAEPAARVNQAALSFAPLLDLLSKGAFSANFNASSLASIKRKQQQMLIDAEETRQKYASLLMDFGQVYGAYDAIDPKTGEHGLSEDQAREELLDLAREHHWDQLEHLIETHGIEAGRQFIKSQDALYRDIMSATTSLKKATGAEEEERADEAYLTDRGGRSGTLNNAGTSPFSAAKGMEPIEAGQPPRAPDFSTTNDYNAQLARTMHISPEGMKMVRDGVAGVPNDAYKDLPKGGAAKDRINRAINMTSADIDRIAAAPNPNNDPAISQRKFAALQQRNPEIASRILGYAGYELDPKDETIANRGRILGLTRQIFPDYNQEKYAEARQFLNEKSTERKIMERAGAAVQPMINVLEALKPMAEKDSIPTARIKQWWAGAVENDPKYRNLAIAIRQLAQPVSSIQTGGGTVRVSIMKEMLDQSPTYVSPTTIRMMLQQEASDMWGFIGGYQKTWRDDLKKDTIVPGSDKEMWQEYSTILRIDPKTGYLPPDAPNVFLRADKTPPGAKDRPMTAKQARDNSIMLSQVRGDPDFNKPDSPRYERLQHVYDELRKKEIPVKPPPPWSRPEMD